MRGEVDRAYGFVMNGGVVFCDVIAKVGVSGWPVGAKLLLIVAASEPMKSHIHGLGAFGLDGIGHNTKGRGVVDLNGGWGLGMAHGFEELSLRDGLTRVDEECAEFGFGRRGHDCFDDLGDSEYSAVVGGICIVFGQKEMSSSTAARLGFGQIGCVAVNG